MHSCKLIINLHAKKVLCQRAEVAKNFRYCNHRLCFLQCDWQLENYPQTAINVNEAWGIGWMSLGPLLAGGVWAWDYFCTLSCTHTHTQVYYKEAVGAFVVFDVTRLSTFEAVQMWKADLDNKVLLPNGKPIPAILLANKVCRVAVGWPLLIII